MKDEAVPQCSALSSSQQSSIRNTLIANCGTGTFLGSPGGCCGALEKEDWGMYLHCLCAGDAVLSGLSAFVDSPTVIAACGCDGANTPPSLGNATLQKPGRNGATTEVSLPPSAFPSASPQTLSGSSGNVTSPQPVPAAGVPGGPGAKSLEPHNPTGAEILASQGG